MAVTINIGAIDAWVVLGYMLLVLLFGLWVGRAGRTAADYFLGDRSLPWGALLLSIVATETSTVTFLSIPGIAAAAGGNMTFLQITIGYVVGRLFVVFVLLPLYFKGQPFTAYEVLESRFGVISRRLVSSLFLLTRNVSDALRLFLTALVLQLVLGLDLALAVLFIAAVTVVYTFIGGAKSVIWNDCIQFVVYCLGAVAAAVIILKQLPGGLTQYSEFALAENRLRVFDFSMNLTAPAMTFWAGLIGGAFLSSATHGTDQLMVQRYLAAKNRAAASVALGLSGFIVMVQFAAFLLIGIGLAAMYGPAAVAEMRGDQLFAQFIVDYMPVGVLGLTLAAVFAAAMSTLSSSLNSSASAFINDLYLPTRGEGLTQGSVLQVSRLATIAFGALQVTIAIAFSLAASNDSVVANVLKVSGFAAGPVLGLYLLGVFVRQLDQRSALSGFIAGVIGLSFIAYSSALHWAWYAMSGALLTVLAGFLVHTLRGARR